MSFKTVEGKSAIGSTPGKFPRGNLFLFVQISIMIILYIMILCSQKYDIF